MEHVASQNQFWDVAPAADRIFVHIRSDPALSELPLDFDYALVDAPSSRAVAKFSCGSTRGCAPAVVWVTAATQSDGDWVISHCLHWGE